MIGDWNAKVGSGEVPGVTGRFGLGQRNDRGARLIAFCTQNSLKILNTKFQQHSRRLYTWKSPDKVTRNQIDFLLCHNRWESSVNRVTTLPSADCGTDHNLLIMEVKLKLKCLNRPKIATKYDINKIGDNFKVELSNRFEALYVEDKAPNELWTEIKETVREVADRNVPKQERKTTTEWLSEKAISIAHKRREAKAKPKDDDGAEWRRLNAEFQKQARRDKEAFLQEKCKLIEENNRRGRTRDLFKEIKNITSKRNI